MRQIVLVSVLLIMAVGLTANPVMPQFLSEFWFEPGGCGFTMMMELAGLASPLDDFSIFRIYDGVNYHYFPNGFTYPDSTNGVINATEVFPGIVGNPMVGFLQPEMYFGNQVWVPCNYLAYGSYPDAIAPPVPLGQSFVMDMGLMQWSLDQPPTPGNSYFMPIARGTVHLMVTDSAGNTLSGVNIYQTAGDFYPIATNISGDFTMQTVCTNVSYYVTLSQYPGVSGTAGAWVYPNNTTELLIELPITAADDQVNEVEGIARLSIFPNPMPAGTQHITGSLKRSTRLSSEVEVSFYDLRGRKLETGFARIANGEFSYDLAAPLRTGIYLVKVSDGKTELGTQKLIVVRK